MYVSDALDISACSYHYGTTHGSKTEPEEGTMEKMGTTMKVKGGPLLGSRYEG